MLIANKIFKMENQNYLYSDISTVILKAYYNVYNTLGFGFFGEGI